MSQGKSRKELIAAYKERKVTGGVYMIQNTKNQKIFLDAAIDLNGSKNRFEFSKSTGSCVVYNVQKDWKEFGPEVFQFMILEEIEQNENQTISEFKEDLELLKEMWRTKFPGGEFY